MKPYPYHNNALEVIARNVIMTYNPRLLTAPAPIPVETIIERVYGLTLDFQFIRNNGRVLGETVFEDAMVPIYEREGGGYKLLPVKAGTVIIDASLLDCRGDGRFRFTCAHELAHWIIHKDYYTQLGETAASTVRSSEADSAIERQADCLSSHLLMPKGTVKMAFHRNRGKCKEIVPALADTFGVSRKAMEIRLTDMRLLP